MWLAVTAAMAGDTWLVGVRNGRDAYSTWWVSPAGLAQLGPGLAVPTAGGWWRVEPVHNDVGGYHGEDVRLVPPEGPPREPPFSVEEAGRYTGRLVVRVVSVGDGWWTTERWSDVESRSGPPLRGVTPVTERFPPVPGGLGGVPLRDVLGLPAEEVQVAAGNALRATSDCLSYPSMTSWGVRWGAAGWEVYGRLSESWGCPEAHPDYVVPVAPPEGYVGGLAIVADDAGLHLAGRSGTTDAAVTGARIVLARPVPPGHEAEWRAAVEARLAR